MRLIDMHVHMVGTGSDGTGCWMRSGGWKKPMEHWMCRHIGLPASAFDQDFDRLYRERLLHLVKESSLDAAVILAQENVYDSNGKLMEGVGSFYVPNTYVLDLAGQHSEFLPAVSIHPARPDAMEELERCLVGGAVMLKILPNCHNIDCNDKRYTKFWERMAEAGLPLLAHTGGEHTLPVVNPAFSNPRVLELPLQCGVTVIAAHSASKSGLTDPEFFWDLGEMMKQYSNLYADNSAFNIPIRSRVYRPSMTRPWVDRMVHGSDYPVLIYGHWAWMRGLIDYATLKQCQNETNVLERDLMLKRAIGFPDAVFARGESLLRKSIFNL